MLLVVLLADPGFIEVGLRAKSGSTSPDREVTISTGVNANLVFMGGKGDDLRLKTVSEALVHGGTTGEDNVLLQLLSNVNVGGLDGFPSEFVDRIASLSEEAWLEEKLWACHAGEARNGDNIPIWESVLLVERGGLFYFVILCNITKLFFNITSNLQFACHFNTLSIEKNSWLLNELFEIGTQHISCNFHLFNGERNCEAFVDWNGVGNTISSIDNETSGATSGIDGHDGLNSHVKVLDLEGFEHNLSHSLSVLFGVTGGFGKKNTSSL